MSPSDPRHLRVIEALNECSDEDLMGRYRDGEPAAFDILVRRHRRSVLSFLHRTVGDGTRAEELLGDVFLKLHRAAPRYEPSAKFTTYLYTVAYRAALNARDKARHQLDSGVGGDAELERHAGSALATGSRDPEQRLADKQAIDALDRELAALSEGHRATFVLYYQQQMSCAEVAACLGITAAEAKGRLAYARKLLRTRLTALARERGGR